MGLKSVVELIVSCLVYCLGIAFVSFGVLFLFIRDLGKVWSIFPLVLLLEGGLGMIAGGALASFSAPLVRMSEILLRSKPWDGKRQKETEIQARVWIATSFLLILAGFLASLLHQVFP